VNRTSYFIPFLVPLLFVSCVSPPTAAEAARLNIFVSRWDDVRAQKKVPRMSFAKNDLPTPVVQNLGWKEQRVTMEVIRQDTGKIVYQSSFLLARNETRAVKPKDPLTAGTYHLKVTPENSPPVVQNFSVYGY
jgi:hypothetical protein